MGTIIPLKCVSAVLTDATCRILFYFMFSSYLFLMEQFVEGYYLLRKIGRIKELFAVAEQTRTIENPFTL